MDIPVRNMTSVLPKMSCYPVGAGFPCKLCSMHRIGMQTTDTAGGPATRLDATPCAWATGTWTGSPLLRHSRATENASGPASPEIGFPSSSCATTQESPLSSVR